MGTINAFNRVELNNPPKITFAIGLWISFPGRSPPIANGMRARAEDRAVIKIGLRRSNDPCMMVSSDYSLRFEDGCSVIPAAFRYG